MVMKEGNTEEANDVVVSVILGDVDCPQISLLALNGFNSKGYRTIRVTIYVDKKPLHILIDSGSNTTSWM